MSVAYYIPSVLCIKHITPTVYLAIKYVNVFKTDMTNQ